MKRVINISEETYEYWKEHKYEYVLAEAIANSTLLTECEAEDCIDRKALIDTTICEGISCTECLFNEIDGNTDVGCLLHKRVNALPSVYPKSDNLCKGCDYDDGECCRKLYEASVYPKSDKPSGKWIKHTNKNDGLYCTCSNCGYPINWTFEVESKYCPNCGTKMEQQGEK